MKENKKIYPTIACCGIDCGLCPRFYTKGDSACPGCGGENFKAKHPSCGFLTCCFIKKGHEVCSDCDEYACSRFEPEKGGYDSFVTHRKVFENLDSIKELGIKLFIETQRIRIEILKGLLAYYDDGRAKSFFCLACTLLPLDTLRKVYVDAEEKNMPIDVKEKCKFMRSLLNSAAESNGIELKLRNKS